VASAERVFELLDEDEESPDAHKDLIAGDLRGQVAFENVSFRYIADQPLIEDLSLRVSPVSSLR